MKQILPLVALTVGLLSGYCQSIDTNWTAQYGRFSLFGTALITELPSSKYLVTYGEDYYEINSAGDSLKKGILQLGNFSIKTIASGKDYILAGGTEGNVPAVAKLDLNYDTLWKSTFVNTSFAEGVSALLVDGNDIYASGSYQSSRTFVTKLDQQGDTTWFTELQQTTFANLTTIQKLNDGNYIAAGNIDDYPYAVKFDSNGDTVWTYYEPLFISFSKMSVFERSNGEIVLFARHKAIELNADGTKKKETDYENNKTVNEVIALKDTLYLIGDRGNIPFVEMRKTNLDSLSNLNFTKGIFPNANNGLHRLVALPTQGFIAVGRIRDSINITANTYNLFATKIKGTDTLISTIESIQITQQPVLYPNPARDAFQLENKYQLLQLVDYTGKQYSFVQTGNKVRLEHVSPGIYFAHIAKEEEHSVIRLIVSP